MKTNPYTKLVCEVQQLIYKLTNRKQYLIMSIIDAEKPPGNFEMWKTFQRVQAAECCGQTVIVKTNGKNLDFYIVEKAPDIPLKFQ